MAEPMYGRHLGIIESFKKELRRGLPEAFAYINNETEGAATGLEYRGMLRNAIIKALDSGLISEELR